MIKFTMKIRMNNSEGVLERLLGKLRQRNFHVSSFSADCSPDMTAIEARITVNSHNSAELAIKHLDKLYDIQQIQLLPAEKNNRLSTETYKEIGEKNEVCLSV